MPEFSVIIPAFNRAHTLERAVSSACRQTVDDLEIMIGDDGSTDHTLEVASRLAAEDSRIRLIHWQPNLGVSAARNRLIRSSDSEFVCLLDSDDAWEPEKLELQQAALEEQPATGCCHTKEFWFRKGKKLNPPPGSLRHKEDPFFANLSRCTISPSCSVIRRKLLEGFGDFDEGLFACEDQDLWLRLALWTDFLSINRPLTLRYGGRADQLSAQIWGLDRFRIISLLKIEEMPLSAEQRHALCNEIALKAGILEQGFAKRGKKKQASLYRRLNRLYREKTARISQAAETPVICPDQRDQKTATPPIHSS